MSTKRDTADRVQETAQLLQDRLVSIERASKKAEEVSAGGLKKVEEASKRAEEVLGRADELIATAKERVAKAEELAATKAKTAAKAAFRAAEEKAKDEVALQCQRSTTTWKRVDVDVGTRTATMAMPLGPKGVMVRIDVIGADGQVVIPGAPAVLPQLAYNDLLSVLSPGVLEELLQAA